MSEQEEQAALVKALQEAVTMHMPFGKYGPREFPPAGIPLCDLPFEYLDWFQRKGFPPGRLGELMKLVLQLKRDGAEEIFDALRPPQNRTSLRKPRKTSWSFED